MTKDTIEDNLDGPDGIRCSGGLSRLGVCDLRLDLTVPTILGLFIIFCLALGVKKGVIRDNDGKNENRKGVSSIMLSGIEDGKFIAWISLEGGSRKFKGVSSN